MDAGSWLVLAVALPTFAVATVGLVAGSFAAIEAGWGGMIKSAALWAVYGVLAGFLNGSQAKTGEHPSLLASLAQALALALPLALAAAAGGALFGGLYGAAAHGSLSGIPAATVLRIAIGLLGGVVLGAIAGLLWVQIFSAGAAVIGALVNYQPDQNLLQHMAESAQGMMQEGGIVAVGAGAILGAIAGLVIGILNLAGA